MCCNRHHEFLISMDFFFEKESLLYTPTKVTVKKIIAYLSRHRSVDMIDH